MEIVDISLLFVRVVIGALFVGHGMRKLAGWFAGSGLDATTQFFAAIGYRRARTMAITAGLTEVGAGLALAFGAFTPLAAAAVIGAMVNAAVAVHGAAGLWVEDQGYEYPVVLITIAIAIAFLGPGAISLDAALGLSLDGAAWGAIAVAVGALSSVVVLATRRTASTGPEGAG